MTKQYLNVKMTTDEKLNLCIGLLIENLSFSKVILQSLSELPIHPPDNQLKILSSYEQQRLRYYFDFLVRDLSEFLPGITPDTPDENKS